MHRSHEVMIFIGNFNKNLYISVISIAKPKNFVVFSYTYVPRSQALFNDNFCMNLYFIDSDEVMKRGNEALNTSSLQFL
jgi:hypothetical protein